MLKKLIKYFWFRMNVTSFYNTCEFFLFDKKKKSIWVSKILEIA